MYSIYALKTLVINNQEYIPHDTVPKGTFTKDKLWELYQDGYVDIVLDYLPTEQIDLNKLPKEALVAIAKEIELPAYWTMKKSTLVDRLTQWLT